MSVQWSTALRNALLDQIETTIGASPKLRIYSGGQPASCAAARSGVLIAEFALPSDWMTNASAGVKAMSGLPISTAASAAGIAGHYAIMDSAGTTCHEQGSVTVTAGGGDMTVDNTNVAANQNIQITAYSKTAPAA